jgi:tetratricopeptide (TPR) repeat protein
MADIGGVESVLGGESEASEGDAPVAGADAAAVALALQEAHRDSELSRTASEYFAEQRALVKLQIRHFEEERRLAIAAAKRKRLSDRLRIGLQLIVGLVALGAVLGLVAMFWDALRDRGISVEAFAVPPDLVDKGLTGQVIAKKLLDRITEIDRASYTVRAANSFANNWGQDLKVVVPETGISIGEISHWIHQRFGHATRVDGEIYHTSTGITVSVRVGNDPAIETSGTEASLPALVQDVATRVYARTQPYRYGFWLASQGNFDEANAVYRRLYVEGNAIDRIWALHGLANDQDTPAKQVALERRVLAADPHFSLGALDVALAEENQGHEQTALSGYLAAIADERGFADKTLSTPGRALLRASADEDRDVLLCDYQSAYADASEMEAIEIPGALRGGERVRRAAILLQLHEPTAAAELLDLVASPTTTRNQIRLSEVRSRLAAEQGDWQAALLEIERTNATNQGESVKALPLHDPLFAAELYARAGRNAKADEILTSLTSDNYNGWRARARVAVLRQNYTVAEQALAEAVRQAPSIALAYNEWGDLSVAKGDLSGAIIKYADANQRGPHWADPLKSWGDALAKQGQTKAALAKYNEALRYAPNWAALKQARDAMTLVSRK